MDAQDRTMLTSDKTMVAPAMGADATVMGASVTCPVCKTENAPTEMYCGDCGFLLSSTPVEVAATPDISQLPRLADASGQREYLLKDGENTIGREATDVLLGDPTVSRRHAMLVLDGGKAFLEDLGSSNGTSASGVRVTPGDRIEVADGAELKLGSAVLTLILPAPVEAPETPEETEVPPADAIAEETPPEVAEAAETAEPPTESMEAEAEVVVEPNAPVPVAVLVSDSDPTKQYGIVPGSNAIGRRGGNDIVLDGDPYVSGAHADVTADERGYWLTDLGSTNGTFLNGTRIQPNVHMALKSGDEIVFGQTALRLEIPEAETAEESGASADE